MRLGYLIRVRGKGTFVRDNKVIEKISLLGSFTDSLRGQGLEPAFTVTCAAVMAPPPEVRDAFDSKPRRLFRLDRLASVADGPLALLTAWLDPARFPDLGEQDFATAPLYATLERLHGVQMGRALSTIEVVQLRDEEAALLQLPPGASALQVQGTTFDQNDRATEVSRVLYRADRFTFSLESHRVGGRAQARHRPASDGPPFPVRPGRGRASAQEVIRMTSTPARATGAPQDSNFTRNATGLVREVSMWDALIMNTLGMNVAVGSVLLLQQAPAIFPGGNLVLAVIIGTVIMAFTLLWVYSEFSAAMPSSGGDYVFVSRALHPFLGWLLSWSQGVWLIFFWIGFNAWFALVAAVPTAHDHHRLGDRRARAGSPRRTTCWPSTTSSASTCSGTSSCSARC